MSHPIFWLVANSTQDSSGAPSTTSINQVPDTRLFPTYNASRNSQLAQYTSNPSIYANQYTPMHSSTFMTVSSPNATSSPMNSRWICTNPELGTCMETFNSRSVPFDYKIYDSFQQCRNAALQGTAESFIEKPYQ
jgi:hypothetical protein